MKKMEYEDVKSKPSQLLAMTGMKVEEFEKLLGTFEKVWEKHTKRYTLGGKPRERVVKKERKNGILTGAANKLFFILYQIKNNPLQETLSANFGMNQPQANKWLKLLSNLLKETLAIEKVLPIQQGDMINEAVFGESEIIIDATERPIQRSLDNEIQEEDFSGKKTFSV